LEIHQADNAYLVTSKEGNFLGMYSDHEDRSTMEEVSEKYKGVPCHIEYMPWDLAHKKMHDLFNMKDWSQFTDEDEEEEDYNGDGTEYDVVTSDERWQSAWEQKQALHR
jgi:hypothetical protein